MDISTRDHPRNLRSVDLTNLDRQRKVNQKGSEENRAAPEVKQKLSAWSSKSEDPKADLHL